MKWPSLRTIMTYALMGGGVVMTAFSIWLVWIVWKGGWSPAQAPQQLEILGWALLSGLGAVIVVLLGIAIAGPIKNVKGGAGPVNIEIEGDE